MSNTSYPFKENSNVMNVQGGEKKVMKKILSVALSTAMAFSMFASVAFGDTTLSTQAKYDALAAKGVFNGYPDGSAGLEREMTRAEFAKVLTKLLGLKEVTGVLSYTDKNYVAGKWMVPYVEAVTAAGLMEGKNTEKKIFDFNGNVTVEELAAILVRALDLEVPTTTDNTASVWAKGYVEAAIKAGFLNKDDNFQANAKRSLLVETAYAVDLIKNPVITAADKIQSVSATNLKQVVVAFDGEVDAKTAGNKSNYSITGVNFKSATLADDKKSVTLLIEQDSTILSQQKEYSLAIKNVKNSNGTKTFSETVKFSPVDTTLPEAKEVVGLGTKAFKVEFSEPVQQSTVNSTGNFLVDGKAVSGYVDFKYPSIAIISTDLAVGEHTLTINNVTDYAGFKIAPKTINFTVVEDKAAPEVVKASTNDLSSVTIEFNETVKSVSKIYHTSTGKTANKIEIYDNEVTAYFSDANQLSLAETTVYIEGVTDYSNNSANREVKVTPVLDTERPAVVGVTAEVYNNSQVFTVDFSEAVYEKDIQDTANFTLKDSKGNVVKGKGFTTDGHPVNIPQFVDGSNGKSVKFATIGQLDAGVYTLEISNIRDTAAIRNVMLPYSTTVDLGDIQRPEIVKGSSFYEITQPGNDTSITGLDITVKYSKPVAYDGTGAATDVNKYNYSVGTGAAASTYLPLPTDASVTLVNAQTVKISLPAKQGGYLAAGDLLNLRVVNVADQNGNYIAGNVSTVGINWKNQSQISLNTAKATADNKIVAEFNGTLSYVDANDFAVEVANVTDSTYKFKLVSNDQSSGKSVVTLELLNDKKFAADIAGHELVVRNAANSTNEYGLKASGSVVISDSIAPSYVEDSAKFAVGTAADTYTATLTFNEALVAYTNPSAFSVNVNGTAATVKAVAPGANANQVVVTFEYKGDLAGQTVELYLSSNNDTAKFIADTNGNAAKGFQVVDRNVTLN